MKKFFFLIIFLSISASGCLGSKPQVLPPAAIVPAADIEIVSLKDIKKGATVFVVPFKAGEKAAATPALDKVALSIIKGLADTFDQNPALFKLLPASQADQADYILEGYVENFSEPARLKRWVLQQKESQIAVSGYLRLTQSSKKVLVFRHDKAMRTQTGDLKDLGYQIGQDLALAILQSMDKE